MEYIKDILVPVVTITLTALLLCSYHNTLDNLETIENLQKENLQLISKLDKLDKKNYKLHAISEHTSEQASEHTSEQSSEHINEQFNDRINDAIEVINNFDVTQLENSLPENSLKWSLLFTYDLFSAYCKIQPYKNYLIGRDLQYLNHGYLFYPQTEALKDSITNSVNTIFTSLNETNYFFYSRVEKELIDSEIESFIQKIQFFTQDYIINYMIDSNALSQNTIVVNPPNIGSRLSFVMSSDNHPLSHMFDKNYKPTSSFL